MLAGCVHRAIAIATITMSMNPGNSAHSHEGRRFQISVQGGQLVAVGVNTGPNDGAPPIRPYGGAIHDHWKNSLLGLESASSTLPGFDIFAPSSELVDWPLQVTLLDVHRWNAPPMNPPSGTVPALTSLDTGEVLRISSGLQTVSSTTPGSLLLLPTVPLGGIGDIDLLYEINRRPSNSIAIIRFVLHSGNPAIADSDPVHVILSPDGTNPMQRLHHASLYLEQYLAGYGIPEPAAIALLLPLLAAWVHWQRSTSSAFPVSGS